MKKSKGKNNILKYAGLCSLVLGAIAFVLMMVTPAVSVNALGATVNFSGTDVIFGLSNPTIAQAAAMVTTSGIKPSVLALIAWILAVAGLAIVLLGVIMPLLKVKAFTKFAGLLNLIAVGCLVVAGIFMFIVLPTFYGANGIDVPNNASIGAGWVIGGIIFIVAGAVAILPAVVDFISKK